MRTVRTAEKAQRRQEGVAAMMKEAAMLEASRHSSVVQCLGICKDPPALIMEWCYRGNLSEPTPNFLASASAVDVFKLLHDAAAAVAHLHSQERRCRRALVHGDLRACNVLLKNRGGPDWGIKVADFGLAEWLQPDGKAAVPLVTNRCWVAPEVPEPQFGPYTVSRASEVYMFGMLMYKVLTGKIPYWDELDKLQSPQKQMAPHFWNVCKHFGPLELPAALRFSLPSAIYSRVRDLYQQCASPDPATRPSMLEVVQQLDGIINLLVSEGG